MTRICFVGVCFLLGLSEIAGCTALVQSAEAALSAQQSRVRLFISCDIDCTWTIDGAHHGALKKDQEDRLDLPLGKHKLEATSSHGQRRAETLDISAPTEEHIEITFVTNSPLIDQASVAAATEINPSQPVKPPAEQSSEADSAGIPRFYAQARQILVEADVYDKKGKAGKASPLVPTPLVSKNVEFFPSVNSVVPVFTPLSFYFEIYEPLLAAHTTDVFFNLKMTDLGSGPLLMDTGPMSAANWVLPGNEVIPIGIKVATEKLPVGSYKLEVQASDSAGRQTAWRQATFVVH